MQAYNIHMWVFDLKASKNRRKETYLHHLVSVQKTAGKEHCSWRMITNRCQHQVLCCAEAPVTNLVSVDIAEEL